MPWIKVDDHYNEHRKFADAGPLGHALWLAGMAYCNRNLTDGHIPWGVARNLLSWEFLGPPENGLATIYRVAVVSPDDRGDDDFEVIDSVWVLDILVRVGLWERDGFGYYVHDYEKYQPTKEQVETDRAAKVAAGQAGGIAAARARARAAAIADGVAQSKPVPVPVPVPIALNERSNAREVSQANDDRRLVGGFTAEERWVMAEKATDAVKAPPVAAPRPTTKPPDDEETITRCQAILADPDSPDWRKTAAREQLTVMGVSA